MKAKVIIENEEFTICSEDGLISCREYDVENEIIAARLTGQHISRKIMILHVLLQDLRNKPEEFKRTIELFKYKGNPPLVDMGDMLLSWRIKQTFANFSDRFSTGCYFTAKELDCVAKEWFVGEIVPMVNENAVEMNWFCMRIIGELARDKDTPDYLLGVMLDLLKHDSAYMHDILRNENTPKEAIWKILGDKEVKISSRAIDSIMDEIPEKYALPLIDKLGLIALSVLAETKKLSIPTYKAILRKCEDQLLQDSAPIYNALAQNPHIQGEIMETLAQCATLRARFILSERQDLSQNSKNLLANDRELLSLMVKEAAAKDKNNKLEKEREI